MISSEELKPCPICGGAATVEVETRGCARYIWCKACSLRTGEWAPDEIISMIRRWNDRVE